MTLERTIAGYVQDGRCDLDAARQSMERDPSPHVASCLYRRVLEPSLVWLVGSHPGCHCRPLDTGQSRRFAATHSLDHFMSKGAMGERVWLNRDAVPFRGITVGSPMFFQRFLLSRCSLLFGEFSCFIYGRLCSGLCLCTGGNCGSLTVWSGSGRICRTRRRNTELADLEA